MTNIPPGKTAVKRTQNMEAVNGGYFRTPSLELKVPKEVADSIGEYFRGELLTARGKCFKEVPLTARGKC